MWPAPDVVHAHAVEATVWRLFEDGAREGVDLRFCNLAGAERPLLQIAQPFLYSLLLGAFDFTTFGAKVQPTGAMQCLLCAVMRRHSAALCCP